MERAGMVHALQQVHRLLKPNGRLLEIHPTTGALIEIHRGGIITFSEPVPAYDIEDIHHAERALAQVIQGGLFGVERVSEFDFRTYGSSVTELWELIAEASAFDNSPLDEEVAAQGQELSRRVEGLMRRLGDRAEVAYYEKARMTRLAPL
jgi:hypothetical protein